MKIKYLLIDTSSKAKLLIFHGGTFSLEQFSDAVGLTSKDLEERIDSSGVFALTGVTGK